MSDSFYSSLPIEIRAYAKVNLFLQITGKREDGYHLLHSLMCRIGLFDRLVLAPGSAGIEIDCDHPEVPADHNNLVYKAAALFFNRLGSVNVGHGVKIVLHKSIPVAAGLGGGSSDAAAVLKGLNQLFGTPFSVDQLMEIGLGIGADVPFFIFGRPALAVGIGEKLTAFEGLQSWPVVLINPGFCLSTAMVYKKLNLRLTKCKKKLIKTNFKGFRFNVPEHLCNDLETVTIKEFPGLMEIKETLVEHGAVGSLMSGSGPTVFGLFANAEMAQTAYRAIKLQGAMRKYLTQLIV